MSSMTLPAAGRQPLFAGIDTHKATHHAAVVDRDGTVMGDREFATTIAGNIALTHWLAQWQINVVGVEQTGTYGAGITRRLVVEGYVVTDVNHPDPTVRAMTGKSDPVDAIMAANAVRTGRARAAAKNRAGVVESIRLLQVARHSAVKARTTALVQLRDLAVIAPAEMRERLGNTGRQIMTTSLTLRADRSDLSSPTQAAKLAARSIAVRVRALDAEIRELDVALTGLVTSVAPRLLALRQVGVHAAAQLLITFGQAPDRIRTDAQFARLIGVAPIPASSGKTRRMRLHSGGDRQANKTVHMIAVGRLRDYPPAIDYVTRRMQQGLSKKDAIRAMKRLITREVFGALKADLRTLDEP